MDQRSDDIRHDIESTRASLDDKLEQLEHRAKETFDLKHQVQEHPFMMLGAAVLTGYVLGSLGGNDHAPRQQYSSGLGNSHSSHADGEHRQQQGGGILSQFDEEINMLKAAAFATVGGLFRDIVREVAPSVGRQMESMRQNRQIGGGMSSMHDASMGNGHGIGSSDNSYSNGRMEQPMRAGGTYPEPMVGREEHH